VVPVTPPDKNGLAYTGSSIKGPLVLGGALLALGAGVLLHLRRTRHRT
jgi:LPXTG-motif cell wall-anchored protein